MKKDIILIQKESLGTSLREIREAKNISKISVMNQCGFSNTLIINNIEKGKSSYTVDSLLLYASAIGVELSIENKNSNE